MELLKEFIKKNTSEHPDFKDALEDFCVFLDNNSAPLENIDFTPYRLANIFNKHIADENSISILIEFLCHKEPVILKPAYYFQEDEWSVKLDEKAVYLALTKKTFKSPISDQEITNFQDHFFVIYNLSEGVLKNE